MPQIAQGIAVRWWHRSRVLLPSVSASSLENHHTKVLLVAAGSLAEQRTEEEEKRKLITDLYFMYALPYLTEILYKTLGWIWGRTPLFFCTQDFRFLLRDLFYLNHHSVYQVLAIYKASSKSDTTKITMSFFSSYGFPFRTF